MPEKPVKDPCPNARAWAAIEVGLRLDEWLWGKTPEGFKRIAAKRGKMIVARRGLEEYFVGKSFSGGAEASGVTPFQGRGRLTSIVLPDGASALVRSYRRGGMVRYLTRDLFCTWPPRPFVELAATEHARHRSISTLEVVAACVERSWGPFYRGWFVTRELTGSKDLWTTLREGNYTAAEKTALLKAVAERIRWMHLQGVYHPDLNLKNLLVRKERSDIQVYIIDFDKARLFPGAVSGRNAGKNLERLYRSARKLDPHGRWLSEEEWTLFGSFYYEAEFHET
jgi:Lipopolysaccharide kinase (Kdo/WaaP) family